MEHQSTSSPPASPLWNAVRIISAAIALGIVIMALLIGQGVWGGERDLIPGHGYVGNGLMGLAVIQFVLLVALYQRKQASATVMVCAFALAVLLFGQIGLGYSGRANSSLIAWHVPLGVTLMGLSTFNAAFIWLRPAPTRVTAG
jgi:ABC-type transport system involved in multi-copper enzyme maturation permease subunit